MPPLQTVPPSDWLDWDGGELLLLQLLHSLEWAEWQAARRQVGITEEWTLAQFVIGGGTTRCEINDHF